MMNSMITDKDFIRFVDDNKVSKRILENIATNIIEGISLTDRELAIYKEKGKDIEKIIKGE